MLDCNGGVIQTCPADQGCGKQGVCVPACQAATENGSAIGCEYYTINPPQFVLACFAAFVANTWSTSVSITVDRGGQTIDVSKIAYVPTGSGAALTYTPLVNGLLPPGSIALLFLSDSDDVLFGKSCPPSVNVATTHAWIDGTGRGDSFHVTVSAPVSAFDIFPYGGGNSAVTSATLLLPVSVWNTNYVGITAYPNNVGGKGTPWMAIVAHDDDTKVTVKPPVAIQGGGGVPASAAMTPVMFTLKAGEILKLDQEPDLSGTAILADKPIGVWAGNTCAYVPDAQSACDGMHQQIPPVQALGFEYAAVRYRNRSPSGPEESPPWRVVGMVDGTTLTYEPAVPAGAPSTLSAGQVVNFVSPGPFVVRSQDKDHPIYMAGYMTGCSTIASSTASLGCVGDPEFVNIIPPAQYLKSYVFLTDPTYPETSLVVVRKKQGGAFSEVTLDCAGDLSGWKPVGTGGELEYTRIDLVTGDFKMVGNCDNGRHEAHSDAPFGVTVWGWGSSMSSTLTQAVSYAYPAGAGVRTINTVVVPIL